MIIGAIALAVYSFLVCQLRMSVRSSALTATAVASARRVNDEQSCECW
jgi:hypothetical protein